MKKILVSVASKYVHSALAVWYLKAAVPSAEVFECTINQDVSDITQKLIEEKPEILGFSCYIWNIEYVKAMIKMVKKELPDVKIILGGPEVSHNPDDYDIMAAWVICGYGEVAFKNIIERLENGQAVEKIIYGTPLETPPNPFTEDYFNSLNGRIAYIETSRGCPFTCVSCLSGDKEKPTFFDIDRSLNDILSLSQSGAKTI